MKIVWEKFKKTVEHYKLVESADRVLLAVSGGPDSVCLLHLFERLKRVLLKDIKLYIAYIDHGLRPRDVRREKNLIVKYGDRFNIPVKIEKIKIPKRTKQGIEATARKLRYKALLKIAGLYKCNKLATGHNLNDQAETVILNLVRSRSEEGITGMPLIRPLDANGRVKLFRPLMKILREEIMGYIKGQNLKYSIDVTNTSEKFTRNYIRRKIMPLLKKLNPQICEHLDNLARWSSWQKSLALDLSKNLKYNKHSQYKILRSNLMDFTEREDYSYLIKKIADGEM